MVIMQTTTHKAVTRPLFAMLVIAIGTNALAQTANTSAQKNSAEDAIKRITNGLTPAMIVKGAATKPQTITERMARHKVPGVSIAVVEGGKIVWARGYGVTAMGGDEKSNEVNAETLFQAASISKPVSATAMLRLVESGKLALDAPVNQYLKTWQLPENEFTKTEKVTLRRLVTHSAGLGIHGFPGYASTVAVPTVPQVLDGAAPANTKAVRVEATPGSAWRYSGGGTTIMQLAMTDVTGEAFPALMKRLVLQPIGMSQSDFDQPLSAARRTNAAAGHRADGAMVAGRAHTYPELAAAGMWTTPTDLLKWAIEIAAAKAGKSQKVLSQKMVTEMLTTQIPPSGLGPMLVGSGDAFNFRHGGGNAGFACFVAYFPALERGVAIMTNSDNGAALAAEVINAIAKEYSLPGFGAREIEPITLDAAAREQLLGEYPIPASLVGSENVSMWLTVEKNKLMIEVAGFVQKSEFFVLADGKLIAPESGFQATLMKDTESKVVGVDIGSAKLTKKPKG
jgi:CubicO group peptidase (beta-lactamase class C family)